MTQTIALVDDDRNILTSISIALEKEGFKVQTYLDGESALIGLTRTPPDLAVIDIKMPKMDGEELLKKLRKKTSLPVIFLTSKDDEIDELLGLKLGADDFIRKPCRNDVLVARVKARIRQGYSEKNDDSEYFSSGDLKVDIGRRKCFWRGHAVPHLTKTEFTIVSFLARRAGVVRSRDQIISHVYGDGYAITDQAIDTHKKRIVKKFKSIDANFNQIEAEYAEGYRWRESSNSRLARYLGPLGRPLHN